MQKTILRNGLIAIMFAFLMVLVCMPQKASAAVAYDYDLDMVNGTMNGYVYHLPDVYTGTYLENEGDPEWKSDRTYTFYKVEVTVDTGDGPVSLYASNEKKDIDLKPFIDKYSKDGADVFLWIIVTVKDGEDIVTDDHAFDDIVFISVDAQATTDTAVEQDTTFEYEIEAITETYADASVTKRDANGVQFIDNTLTIAKGEKASSADDKLILLIQAAKTNNEISGRKLDDLAYNIKEKSNTGNYIKSPNQYLVATMLNEIYHYIKIGNGDLELKDGEYHILASYENFTGGVDGFINELGQNMETTADRVTVCNKLVVLNTEESPKLAVFKRGVPTADTNELGLWIALFAIAAVCGGAVALKKN